LERARPLAALLLTAALACRGERAAGRGRPIPGEPGPRVTVEVLNASGRPGLARIATRVLRHAGIDVLTFGNAPDAPDAGGALDSTRILVRRGGADVGERVRAALGAGRVAVALDSARLLDASVLVGRDFVPPRREFHP
jgi:calcineurin-like phosphoesterase